jgi:hypothetical protein
VFDFWGAFCRRCDRVDRDPVRNCLFVAHEAG